MSVAQPLADQLRAIAAVWSHSQHRLVVLAVEFADSNEWVLEASTPAQWLALVADVEAGTAREWIRIGRCLRDVPLVAAAFAAGDLSYAKVRVLTRLATPANEADLLEIAAAVPAADLRLALGRWLTDTCEPDELDAHHQRQRSITWRPDPDGMVVFTLRLPPLLAGLVIATLTTLVMRCHRPATGGGDYASAASHPTLAQQHADALETLLTDGAGTVDTEVVLHVRGDGCSLDDGTPIPADVVERIAPDSFLRALIHDAEGRPINASKRQRHPNARQKRVVKERDRVCRDCGRNALLHYDHVPAYEESGHTIVDELELRCAPCHHNRHASAR